MAGPVRNGMKGPTGDYAIDLANGWIQLRDSPAVAGAPQDGVFRSVSVGPYGAFLPGAPTVPTPSGVSTGTIWDWGGAAYNVKAAGAKGDGVTDDGVAIAAANTAATGKGIVTFPGGTYATTAQRTFTAPIMGVGTHSTILAPTALGTGVPAVIFAPPGASAIDWRFPVAQGIQFMGPGSYSLGNKVAGVDGVRLDNKCVMRDCSVRFFDSGIVFNSPFGHISLHNVVSTNNYYG